ncbi:hypothetical protein FJZ36_06870 [Candidatus Poribacteria bacterium]|nr:hypothetical protein [Candidatus Poribacteria bacterium]
MVRLWAAVGFVVVLGGCAAAPLMVPGVAPVLEATGSAIMQKPVPVTLAESTSKAPARKYLWWKVEVPGGSDVTFDVHASGDVNVLLFEGDPQFEAWKKKREYVAAVEVAKVADWKHNVKATQPSVFVLVVSNQHALLIEKSVDVAINGNLHPKQKRAVSSGVGP